MKKTKEFKCCGMGCDDHDANMKKIAADKQYDKNMKILTGVMVLWVVAFFLFV